MTLDVFTPAATIRFFRSANDFSGAKTQRPKAHSSDELSLDITLCFASCSLILRTYSPSNALILSNKKKFVEPL